MEIRVKVVPFKQGEYQCYTGVGEPAFLKELIKVDTYRDTLGLLDPDNGYQRPPTPSRVKKIAKFRQKEPTELFPTSIFLSARKKLNYDEKTGELVFNSDTELWAVDGSHRWKGTTTAMDSTEMIGRIPLPFVLVEGMNKQKEMEMFAVINGTAKSVETALCLQILAMQNSRKALSLIEEESLAQSIIIQTVNRLTSATDKNPWMNQIALVSGKFGKQAENYGKVAKATSLVSSLITVYDHLVELKLFDSSQTQETQIDFFYALLTNYWNAIRAVNPMLFSNTEQYAIQWTSGQYSLHFILNDVLDDCIELGMELSYNSFLQLLSGYALLKDTSYWKADSENLPCLSGSKTYRLLRDKLTATNPLAIARKKAREDRIAAEKIAAKDLKAAGRAAKARARAAAKAAAKAALAEAGV